MGRPVAQGSTNATESPAPEIGEASGRGDGAIAPMNAAAVYAASKASVAVTTECVAAQLEEDGANVAVGLVFRAAVSRWAPAMWTHERTRHGK